MAATISKSDSIADRLAQVRTRIKSAALRAGRHPDEVVLVAVSKMQPAHLVSEAIAAGAADLGENKVQEAEKKIPQVGLPSVRWHLIGHLQSNKTRKSVALFDMIHSIDSISLVQRLERNCAEVGRAQLPVLIQVDLGNEESKSGIAEDALPALVYALRDCRHLRLRGLMTLPPFYDNPEDARPFFRKLRELRDYLSTRQAFQDGAGELSMGMTHDFEVAIEEGATIVRIGTAIFGQRQYLPEQP